MEDEIQEIVRTKKNEPRPPTLNLFIVVLCFVAVIPIVLAVYQILSDKFFELTPPSITALELPEGLGNKPATFKIRVTDGGAGVDEIVVRLKQKKGTPREIFKKVVGGVPEVDESIEIGGEGSGLDHGVATVMVKAFDRSFWSNSAESSFDFKVDYRRPKAEVVSSMHNARLGGSQLAFYRAQDEDLYASGIKVGEKFFYGFSAQDLDPSIDDASLKVALYAVDARQKGNDLPIKVFSQNKARNVFLGNFYNVVLPRKFRTRIVTLPPGPIELQVKDDFSSAGNSMQRETHWDMPFLVPKGSINLEFGDELLYKRDGLEIGKELLTGYLFSFTAAERDVVATSGGTVTYVGKSRKFGEVIFVDHGLGLVSVYDRVENVLVSKGAKVQKGDKIASAGLREGRKSPELYFEIRVQGVPVDAREWWEDRWCRDHIKKKIADMQKLLGIIARQAP